MFATLGSDAFHSDGALAWCARCKGSPALLAFTYQEGATALPVAQTLAIAAAASGSTPTVFLNSGGSQWLTFTPLSGRTTLSVKVTVNPTSLPVGQYAELITVTAPETGGDPVNIPVTLTIRSPPSDIRVAPLTLSVTYRLGDTPPEPVYTHLSTTGALLSYTAAGTGTKWIRLSSTGGAVFPGFRSSVAISVDTADLVPGTQRGTVTISTPDAITKATTVAVILTVQPGPPVATTLWPPRIIRGAPESTFTITGQRFFSGTVLKSGTTTLRSTILGPNSLLAVIPANLLANHGIVPISVSNPDPGGGTAHVLNLEVLPPGPLVLAIVNAASQRPSALSPGAIFTVYGQGLGPEILVAFDGAAPLVPTSIGGTRVYMNGEALPVIYSSARQVSAAASNTLEPDRPNMIEIEYNGVKSVPFPMLSARASPALFTSSGTGTGNAAAFQADPITGAITLNSDKTPASKGNVLVLYATGLGPAPPVPVNGTVAFEASSVSIPNVSVHLGDVPAEVLYSGYTPGLITGIVQINARVPDGTPTGKTVPITVSSGSLASPSGVTINIK